MNSFGEWDFNSLALSTCSTQPLGHMRSQYSDYWLNLTSLMPNEELPHEVPEQELLSQSPARRRCDEFHSLPAKELAVIVRGTAWYLLFSHICHMPWCRAPCGKNALLLSTRSQLTVKHNDQSVLENTHSSLTFRILNKGFSFRTTALNNSTYIWNGRNSSSRSSLRRNSSG